MRTLTTLFLLAGFVLTSLNARPIKEVPPAPTDLMPVKYGNLPLDYDYRLKKDDADQKFIKGVYETRIWITQDHIVYTHWDKYERPKPIK